MGDAEKSVTRQRTVDKLSLLCALQKNHQGLMMQADGVIDLINVVKGTHVANLPAVLPVLGLVIEAASNSPSRAAEEMKYSK